VVGGENIRMQLTVAGVLTVSLQAPCQSYLPRQFSTLEL